MCELAVELLLQAMAFPQFVDALCLTGLFVYSQVGSVWIAFDWNDHALPFYQLYNSHLNRMVRFATCFNALLIGPHINVAHSFLHLQPKFKGQFPTAEDRLDAFIPMMCNVKSSHLAKGGSCSLCFEVGLAPQLG